MPVFLCRVAVALDVADNFRVNFASGVETERHFDRIVLQVAVDSFRATDNLNACADFLVVFSQNGSICVRVVATDNDEGFDAELLYYFKTFVELFFFFEFCSAGADDVETACVAIFVDDVGCQFDVFMIDKSVRSE